jgi:acylpyruvate hydrolase
MKLVTISRGDRTVAGALSNGGVAVVDAYEDVGALLADGPRGLAAAEAAASGGDTVALDEAALRRPVTSPGAVICVGLNYASHIREMGRDLPTSPTLFSKLARALTDPYAPIPLPSISDELDYEGELCVVVGRAGRDIAAEDAWDHVGGLTLMNDVTVRDYQWRTPQWFAGKTWEASTPVGPVVVTPDELGDIGGLEIVVRVDGAERQRGSIDDLVFGVPQLIEDVSRIVTLQPGDLIATGTPGGVGAAMDPKGFLAAGSVVEVEIPGIGALRNRVEAAS